MQLRIAELGMFQRITCTGRARSPQYYQTHTRVANHNTHTTPLKLYQAKKPNNCIHYRVSCTSRHYQKAHQTASPHSPSIMQCESQPTHHHFAHLSKVLKRQMQRSTSKSQKTTHHQLTVSDPIFIYISFPPSFPLIPPSALSQSQQYALAQLSTSPFPSLPRSPNNSSTLPQRSISCLSQFSYSASTTSFSMRFTTRSATSKSCRWDPRCWRVRWRRVGECVEGDIGDLGVEVEGG